VCEIVCLDVPIPPKFMLYSQQWVPTFAGIQPYLLHGLLSPSTEHHTLKLFQLMPLLVDTLADPSPIQKLIMLIATLPYLYLSRRTKSLSRNTDLYYSGEASNLDTFDTEIMDCLKTTFACDHDMVRILCTYESSQPDVFIETIRFCIRFWENFFHK
jgi:hypothetical protein